MPYRLAPKHEPTKSGSYTLFAPDNEAFATVPKTVSSRVFLHINRAEMAKLPAGHLVINPPLTGKRLLDCMAQGEPLQLPTPGGCVLTMSRVKDKLSVTDQSGQTARITNADVVQSNGMMEMIDRVLLPAD